MAGETFASSAHQGQHQTMQAPAEESKPTGEPTIRFGGQPVRVQMNEDGQVESVTDLRQPSHQVLSADESAVLTGRNSYGMPVEPSAFDENTIVYHPSIGDGRVADLLTAGLLAKTATGYELAHAGTPQAEGEQEGQQEQPQADPLVAQDEVIARALPGTSAESDAFVSKVEASTTSQFYESAITRLAQGEDIETTIGEAASRSGMEPEQVRAGITRRVEEGTAAATKAAAAVGVEDFDHFTADLWARDPGKAKAVVLAIARNDIAPLLSAARSYVALGQHADRFTDAEVLGAEFGSGITARRAQDGKVVLAIPGKGEMSFKEALRSGLVKVSR